jgi:hypothetical protein
MKQLALQSKSPKKALFIEWRKKGCPTRLDYQGEENAERAANFVPYCASVRI